MVTGDDYWYHSILMLSAEPLDGYYICPFWFFFFWWSKIYMICFRTRFLNGFRKLIFMFGAQHRSLLL